MEAVTVSSGLLHYYNISGFAPIARFGGINAELMNLISAHYLPFRGDRGADSIQSRSSVG